MVHDPLMRMVKSEYLMDNERGIAYVEVANSAGLQMLAKDERNPKFASSIVIYRHLNSEYRVLDKSSSTVLIMKKLKE